MDFQFFQTKEDDEFFLSNLPNCSKMLDKLFPNKNVLYIPISSNQSSSLTKPFDFSTQKNTNEDEDFVSIDTKTTSVQTKPKGKQNKKTQGQFTQKTKNQTKNTYQQQQQVPKFKMTQTVEIGSSWKIIHDFNKLILEKLKIDPDTPIEVETIKTCGKIFPFREDFQETVSAFNPEKLETFDLKFYGNITTAEDPILTDPSEEESNIFITDRILSVIMTSVYFSHPWHLKISKVGDKIFFDKTDKSFIDYTSVNESDNVPVNEEDEKNPNSYKKLCIEATYINEYIKEQLIYSKEKKEQNQKQQEEKNDNEEEENEDDQEQKEESEEEEYLPNPFAEEGTDESKIENVLYRYRRYTIGDMVILVRCQVHSYEVDRNGKKEFVNIYALNEYDRYSYLTKESNLGSTLIRKELQPNHLKITKWGVCSYLGGVEKLKIAFVTRKENKDTKEGQEHLISGVYEISTEQILKVTNFNKDIAWGIFKEIIDLIQRQKDDGDYILMKTISLANKSMLKLYRVPREAK